MKDERILNRMESLLKSFFKAGPVENAPELAKKKSKQNNKRKWCKFTSSIYLLVRIVWRRL